MNKCEIYRDSMQNYKRYAIPKAQLIIADVPYNVGNNFYGSNPMWYKGGGTIKTVNLNWLGSQHLTVISILTYMSTFIFAQECSRKRIIRNRSVVEVQTVPV